MPSGTDELIEAALRARRSAYAPYSGYTVGAAIEDEKGRIWEGCNVENVSYPVCLCAERLAIGRMVHAGGRRIAAVAVATADGGAPCGMCLQALLEFGDRASTLVFAVDDAGGRKEFKLGDLIPLGFSSNQVGFKNDSPR